MSKRSTPKSKASPRRGFFLVLVLIVIVVATLSAYSFTGVMVAYDDAAYLSADQVQARVAADSGAESTRLLLSQPPLDRDTAGGVFNNPNLFQAVAVGIADPANPCNYSIVAPNINDNGMLSGFRFGLQDESARLNVNTLIPLEENSQGLLALVTLAEGEELASDNLAKLLLLALPNMTEELADAILDWLDEDDEPREYGAEVDYYSTLTTPYEPTNGPILSVEELLRVRGMTPTLLFGADSNQNGVLDPDEQQRFNTTIDTPGALGLAGYLTIHGMEANKARDGSFRVNVNSDDLETLYEDLLDILGNETYASYIVAYRIGGSPSSLAGVVGNADDNQVNAPAQGNIVGPWTPDALEQFDLSGGGGTELTQVLDLIDSTVTVNDRTYQSPFSFLTASEYLPLIMDLLSTSDNPTMPGRINLNECPAELLYGIPFLEEDQILEIIDARSSDSDDENRLYETWPLVEGIVTLDQMRNILPLLTGGGDVYRAQIVGYYEATGIAHRQQVIIDATTVNPKIVSYRDLSHLGRAFDVAVLGTRAGLTEAE
ncbi:MAG: type II secretion system protein GspK [Planctomycetota bacterium]